MGKPKKIKKGRIGRIEKNKKEIGEEIKKIIESFLKQNKKSTLEQLLENSKEKIKKFKDIIPKDSYHIFMHEKRGKEEKIQLEYNIKEKNKDKGYSVNVRYESNKNKEEIDIAIKSVAEEEKEKYQVTIKQDKLKPSNYCVTVRYESMYKKLEVSYNVPIPSYDQRREEALQDFSNKVDKSLHIFPESLMGGILGFTYLGENFMARRADLTGNKAFMVDVHEAIHTPNEYETRVLTAWILTRERSRYKK